jgi:hypothetical protein
MIANHSLYKVTFPELIYSMICFYIKIVNLTEIYIWFGSVLKFAIAYMNDITTNGRGLIAEAWFTIPQEWIDMYCRLMMILSKKTSLNFVTIILILPVFKDKDNLQPFQHFAM